MNSRPSVFLLLVTFAFMGMIIALVSIILRAGRKKRSAAESSTQPLPVPSRTSTLAGLSFLSGLAAIVAVMASGIVRACASLGEVTKIPANAHPPLELASHLVLYVSLIPTVLAVAFALAARGSISESRGTLRGRSLYRTGILLALVSGVLVFDSNFLNPATWLPAGSPGGAGGAGSMIAVAPVDKPHGYLGVEHEPEAEGDGARILRVYPGTPAERAGLRAGDRIVEVDGTPIEAGDSLASRIAALPPGTKVELSARRGQLIVRLTAVLSAPFSALLETLRAQASDASRLSVIRAAGEDRCYSAAQLRQICEVFTDDGNRVIVIEQALPHLSDPDNAYQILNALLVTSAKEDVSRMITERRKPPK